MDLSLKDFNKDNIKLTFDWIQDPEFRRLFLMSGEPAWTNHVKYFETILNDSTQKVFAIYYDNNHIGNCGFKNIKGAEAELWIYIGDKAYKSKGLGKEACKKLVEKGRNEFKFNKIYLHVAGFNTVARNMYNNLDFVEVELDETSKKIWGEKGIEIIKMQNMVMKL